MIHYHQDTLILILPQMQVRIAVKSCMALTNSRLRISLSQSQLNDRGDFFPSPDFTELFN